MTTRADYVHTIHDSPEPAYRTTLGAVPSESRLHSLDTMGALLALVMILGPLVAGAFFGVR